MSMIVMLHDSWIYNVQSLYNVEWKLLQLTITQNRSIQHYVIKFVSVGGFLWFPPSINWSPLYNWNIFESGVKHHKTGNLKVLRM